MDNFNWLVLELLSRESMREHELNARRMQALHEPREERAGVKRALASSLVRLGLRLDPAAGEGLSALELSPAHSKSR